MGGSNEESLTATRSVACSRVEVAGGWILNAVGLIARHLFDLEMNRIKQREEASRRRRARRDAASPSCEFRLRTISSKITIK